MNNPLQGIRDYFRPTNEVRKRDIFREFVNQGGFRPGVEATAKAIPRDMARFAISAAEAPNALRTGKANGKFYNTPFGRINSFQNEAQNRVKRGDSMWKAMGNPMMDTILGGSDLGAVAGMGARAMRGVSPLARDFTNKLGTPFQSRAMQMRPGMTIENQGFKYRSKNDYPLPGQSSLWRKSFVPKDGGVDIESIINPRLQGADRNILDENKLGPLEPLISRKAPFRVNAPGREKALNDLRYEIDNDGVWRHKTGGVVDEFKEADANRLSPSDMSGAQAEKVKIPAANDPTDYMNLVAKMKSGEKRIILPDADPIRPRKYDPNVGDTEQMLIEAGYRSDRLRTGDKSVRLGGIWKLKNKAAWEKFNTGQRLPGVGEDSKFGEPYDRFLPFRFDDETGNIFVKGADDSRSIREQDFGEIDFGDAMKAPRPKPLPISYGSKITDDFVRSWHPVGRDASKERFPKPSGQETGWHKSPTDAFSKITEELRIAEKNLRRAKRQGPDDLYEASNAQEQAFIDFHAMAESMGISKGEYEKALKYARETSTESN